MSKQRKKKKIKSGNVKEAVLKSFLKNPKKRLNAGTLHKKMKVNGNRDSITAALFSLRDEDVLRQVSDNKFVLNRKHPLAKSSKKSKTTSGGKQVFNGKVDMIRSGAAYILIDNLEQDVYVPPHQMMGALMEMR